MAEKQLSLKGLESETSSERIEKTRFTITLPLDISIKVDIEREKSLHTRNDWILMAIKEKLSGEENSPGKRLEKEISEIRDALEKMNARVDARASLDK